MAARLRTAAFRLLARRAGWLLAGTVRLLARSWRFQIDGVENLPTRSSRDGGRLYCFWHGRMLDLVAAHADQGVGVLVSSHPDGEAAAGIIESLGYVPIRGSRLRGAVAGARAMLRFAERGGDLALTPDAHARRKGAYAGAIALARLSGYVLVPVAASARPRKLVASWDRFEIPHPGATVKIRYGDPLRVARDSTPAERRAASRTLEQTLRDMHEALEVEWPEPSTEPDVSRPTVAVGG